MSALCTANSNLVAPVPIKSLMRYLTLILPLAFMVSAASAQTPDTRGGLTEGVNKGVNKCVNKVVNRDVQMRARRVTYLFTLLFTAFFTLVFTPSSRLLHVCDIYPSYCPSL